MDLVCELLELTIFETRCFCSSCRNYCLKRCRCFPMTTELACRKWWTFLILFSGYLRESSIFRTRALSVDQTCFIVNGTKDPYEAPGRRQRKNTMRARRSGSTRRSNAGVQTMKRHLDSGSRDLIQLRRDLREALSKAPRRLRDAF